MIERNTMVIDGQLYGRMPNGWQKFDSEENYELWKWLITTPEFAPPDMEVRKWA